MGLFSASLGSLVACMTGGVLGGFLRLTVGLFLVYIYCCAVLNACRYRRQGCRLLGVKMRCFRVGVSCEFRE